MKKLLLIVPFFMFSLSANSQSETEWLTYETAEFSVQYPEDWELNTSGIMGTSFFLFSPLTNPLDDFKDNISLIKEDISDYDYDLNLYVAAAKQQIQSLIKNGEVISEERKTINDVEYYEIVYSGTQGNYDLIMKQRYKIINKVSYILTFTTKTDVEASITSIGNQILNSVILNENYKKEETENIGKEVINGDFTTFTTSKFTITYPNNWQLDKTNKLGLDLILYAPQKEESNSFKPNLNLVQEDISAYDIDFNQYLELSVLQLEKVITNFKVIENKDKTQNELVYHQMISEGSQGDLDLKFNQYYWLIDGKAYVLTFTADAKHFESYQSESEAIMNTFMVKKIGNK